MCVCVCVCAFFCRPVSCTSACLSDTSTPPLVIHGLLRVNFNFVNLPVNRVCRIIQLRKNSFYCRARLFINLGPRWGCVVDATPRLLYPLGKRPDTHCIGGWVAPGPVRTDTENLAPTGFDPRIFQAVASRYTDWAIPAPKLTIWYPVTAFLRIGQIKRVLLSYENPSSISRVVSYGRTVGQTGMTKGNSRFPPFCKRAQKLVAYTVYIHTYIHIHTHTHTHTLHGSVNVMKVGYGISDK